MCLIITQTNSDHLIGESAEDLLMMCLTDSLGNDVPQVPQHCHEWKRLIVCTERGPCTVSNTQ